MDILGRSRTALFLTVAGRIVPEVAQFNDAERRNFLEPVEHMLRGRPPALRRRFLLFLSLLRWLPLLRHGRAFDRLSVQQQDAVLDGLFRSQLTLLRRGFWGLRTLVFLGYYGRPEIGGRIGYQPRRQGDPGFHA